MKLFQKKIFKYGAFAVALTCVTVAVVIAANVIFASLASHYFWYVDMTGEAFYDVSDEATKLLDGVDKDNDVTIYFLTDKDQLNSAVNSQNYYGSGGLWGMKYIHELALELADEYEYISVDYIDVNKEGRRIREIVGDEYYDQTPQFYSYNIIVDNLLPETFDENGNPVTYYHNYRVYTRDSFYAFNYSTLMVNAFRGDYKLASAILAVTREEAPTVYFVSGHAEAVGEYYYGQKDNAANENYGSALPVWQFFRDCGYNIRKINLQYEDFEEGEAIVVIYAPQTDYLDGSISEIGKLDEYLSKDGHDLMVFMEPTLRSMPNLEGLVKKYCGISFDQAKVKADAGSAISIDGYTFAADIADNEKANSVFGKVAMEGKTVFSNARPISVEASDNTDVLCYVAEGSSMIYSEKETLTAKEDEKALLTVTQLENDNRIICSGSTGFMNGIVLDSDVYVNRDLTYALLADAGEDRVPMNVMYKTIRSEGLDITLTQSRIWTAIVAIAIPLAVAAAGTIVYVRRRHS